MGKEIRIVSKKVGENLVFETMEHSLENMQAKVGGYIEAVSLPMNITMWIDEEGLIKEKPINIVIIVNDEIIHHIAGDIFFTSVNKEGETIGLTDEQITWIVNKMGIVGKTVNNKKEYFLFGLDVR